MNKLAWSSYSLVLVLVFSSCTSKQTSSPTSIPIATKSSPEPTSTLPTTAVPIQVPTDTRRPLADMALKPGDDYFNIDGRPSFIFSRNLAGYTPGDYSDLLTLAHKSGTGLIRVYTDNQAMGGTLGYGYTHTGEVCDDWSDNWEHFFDIAEAKGIYVLPSFTGWSNWNTTGYNTWANNPFNPANGGPARDPTELFTRDSPTQTLYLEWFKNIVTRWQKHKNILGWEVITEINLINGITEQAGLDLTEQLIAVARAADSFHRPINASVAGVGWKWNDFYHRASLDFINVHPYPPSGQLDRDILSSVRWLLSTYDKPVLIGESGLSALTPDSSPPTFTTAANASIALRHAIWAGIVSGAMNGRAFWWEDSYAIYFQALGWPFIEKYIDADRPGVNFVKGVDFSGFKPLTSQSSGAVFGGAVGNEKMVIGWFRDALCEPPDWPLQPVISKQNVIITVPGSAANWQVDFYSTDTGTNLTSSKIVTRKGDHITVALPDFVDDIAFKLYTPPSAQLTPPTPAPELTAVIAYSTTDPIAGKWTGSIYGETGSFSALIDLSIQPGCEIGDDCGTVSVPQLPCSGSLVLVEIDGNTFVFIEQNMTGAASCVSGGYEYLQLQADGTLSFRYIFTSSSGEKMISSGVLERP